MMTISLGFLVMMAILGGSLFVGGYCLALCLVRRDKAGITGSILWILLCIYLIRWIGGLH
jgi:hypothetical protein